MRLDHLLSKEDREKVFDFLVFSFECSIDTENFQDFPVLFRRKPDKIIFEIFVD